MIFSIGIIIFIATYLFLPESPQYIISRQAGLDLTERLYEKGDSVGRNGVMWALSWTVGLVVLMQLCGRTWVLSYVPRLFSLVGTCGNITDGLAALITSYARVIM